MTKLPTVAYGTMCWNPRNTRDIVLEVHRQDYPPELKTHFLLYQKPFPFHFTHPFNHEIRHVNVSGSVWPALWLFKLLAFVKQARSDYLLIFDEDDRFDFDYTQKALEPLLNGTHQISWNYHNVFVQRTRIWEGKYNSAVGTICGERELLKHAAKQLHIQLPEGATRSRRKKTFTGPADLKFRKKLEAMFGGLIILHQGRRYYFRHRNIITKKRNRMEDIDYGWDWTKMQATLSITHGSTQPKDWKDRA